MFLLSDIVNKISNKLRDGKKEQTFQEVAEEWLNYKKNMVKESTYSNYVYSVEKYLYPEYGEMKINKIREEILDIAAQILVIADYPEEDIDFKKKMRWGDKDFAFVRPIRNIVALFGNEIIKTKIAGIETNNKITGHRLLSPEFVEINNPKDYEEILLKKHVIVSREKRLENIIMVGGMVSIFMVLED